MMFIQIHYMRRSELKLRTLVNCAIVNQFRLLERAGIPKFQDMMLYAKFSLQIDLRVDQHFATPIHARYCTIAV